jgi:tRNA nucleotidyltransferase (CCA-adding enzyme)
MKEAEFVACIRAQAARVFLVGGYVRDMLRGAVPQDKDYVVSGLAEDVFCQLFPSAKQVGHSFPVYLVRLDDTVCEVALARREKKNGAGYTGFAVDFSPEVSIEEDLWRRDTTMNSIAMELPEGNIIDPYQGQEDIAGHRICAVSDHFREDPVRALRAARQAAQLGFTISEPTLRYMAACRQELMSEPQERLWYELKRALMARCPSRFFCSLAQTSLLQAAYPEIYALIGKSQPLAFHPEGDAFAHTMQVVDTVSHMSDDILARFAALVHDIGKGLTPPDMLPHHYGHEQRGLEALSVWNKRCTLPKECLQAGSLVIREHMRAPLLAKPGKIVDLLLAMQHSCLSFDSFNAVIQADHGSLPDYLRHYGQYLSAILSISGHDCPEGLQGPAVGSWLREERSRAVQKIMH